MSDHSDSRATATSPSHHAVYEAHGERIQSENDEFWLRLPGPKRFDGARVMDFGCGTGQLTIDLVHRGAAHVLGVEVSEPHIVYARQRLDEQFPELRERIEYTVQPIDTLADESFDFIISKDTFEHVIGLEQVLPLLAQKLAPGGQMLIGFSPLWYSMFGDHSFSKRYIMGGRLAIPWLHVLVGDKRLVDSANRALSGDHGSLRHDIQDFGFNQITSDEFRAIVRASGLQEIEFDTNRSSSRIIDRLGRLPVPRRLRKYWIRSVYAHLAKPPRP